MILRKCSAWKSSLFSGRVYFNFELLKTFLDDQKKKSLAPELFFISTVFDLHFSTGSNYYLHAGSMADNYSESFKDEYVPHFQGRRHA